MRSATRDEGAVGLCLLMRWPARSRTDSQHSMTPVTETEVAGEASSAISDDWRPLHRRDDRPPSSRLPSTIGETPVEQEAIHYGNVHRFNC